MTSKNPMTKAEWRKFRELPEYIQSRTKAQEEQNWTCNNVHTTPTKVKPLSVLGFGIALNSASDSDWAPKAFPFKGTTRNAVEGWTSSTLSIRERDMMKFMGEITDKPDWSRKILDETITKKWRAELMDRETKDADNLIFSDQMFSYCIEEFKTYAAHLDTHGFVPALDSDAVVCKSDSIVSTELKDKLRIAASKLEDVPAKERDWHPDSDEMVLDLVHPSLFPLLYGRSRILSDQIVNLEDCSKFIGLGEVILVPGSDDLKAYVKNDHETPFPDVLYSQNFQWLPCEVAFREDDQVSITSYINNLQPEYNKPLYHAIEQVFAKALPMLDESIRSGGEYRRPTRIEYSKAEYVDRGLKRDMKINYSANDRFEQANRRLVQPEPREEFGPRKSTASGLEGLNLRRDFAKNGLQIIVKMANIHPTPEKPNYGGGSWHIEGSLNEHICATMLYYYDCENITESFLSFRQQVCPGDLGETSYQQCDFYHFEQIFGVFDQENCIQSLGSTLTREGRLITFPNVLQHKVEPFKLADATRPGHRKILAIFVVDPFVRIPSTANVPPQQKEWFSEMALKLDRMGELPLEIAEHIIDSVDDFPIALDEAKQLRLDLMNERRVFHRNVDEALEEPTFAFCEH
ncbi:Hypothetical protein R9X50_00747600 [Acrodontium crateriforme]|uniref:Uncharacterized protein n=1 Tax=Acrodontium crateriforme TaxID=150365 RepID=A0AAQ3MB54_9PEZI|nr:Hypothetical protein R9X50_00747600 [Acrodontium crateriforme]